MTVQRFGYRAFPIPVWRGGPARFARDPKRTSAPSRQFRSPRDLSAALPKVPPILDPGRVRVHGSSVSCGVGRATGRRHTISSDARLVIGYVARFSRSRHCAPCCPRLPEGRPHLPRRRSAGRISAPTAIDLLDLDICRLDDLCPLRDVVCDKLREGRGGICERCTA